MAKKITDENGNTYVQKKPFYKKWWFWLIIVIVLAGGCAAISGNNDQPTAKKEDKTEQSSSKTEGKKSFNVGQTISYNGIEMKVDEVKFLNPTDASEQIGDDEQFVAVEVTLKNNEKDNVDYNLLDFKLNADGNSTSFTSVCGDQNIQKHVLETGSLQKGGTVTGWLVGKAKKNTKKLQLQYTGNLFDEESKIDVNLK